MSGKSSHYKLGWNFMTHLTPHLQQIKHIAWFVCGENTLESVCQL